MAVIPCHGRHPRLPTVIPAKAGIHKALVNATGWIPGLNAAKCETASALMDPNETV